MPAAHVLILDDDIDIACAAQLLLRRRYRDGKVDTLCAPAGLPAPLAQAMPDVVLLDLHLQPGQTDGARGLALLDLLRAPARPSQPLPHRT